MKNVKKHSAYSASEAQAYWKKKHAQGLFDLLKKAIDTSTGFNWLSPVFCRRGAYSFDSGKPYRGSNRFLLNLATLVLGYQSNCWITTGQIKKLNEEKSCNIQPKNKDEKFVIIFWGVNIKKDPVTHEPILDDDGEEIITGTFLNHFEVYNVDNLDTNGYDLKVADMKCNEDHEEVHSMEEWDKVLFKNYKGNKPALFHDQNGRNFYRITSDEIHLCPFNKFRSLLHYIATLAHEAAHSTGAANRLNRKGFDVQEERTEQIYDKEELIAEFGSCIIRAHFGLFEELKNSVEYLKGYYSALQEDPTLLFDAYKAGEKAAAYILGIKQEEL